MARDLAGWAALVEFGDIPPTLVSETFAAVLRAMAGTHQVSDACHCVYCNRGRAVLAALAPLAPLFPDTEGGSDDSR